MRTEKAEPRTQSGTDKSYVETTIQGCRATFFKIKNCTKFVFDPFPEPEEISRAEFMAPYGSQDPIFVFGLIKQLADASPRMRQIAITGYDEIPDVEAVKSMLAHVRALAPRDPLEAITCAQMAVVHSLSMMFSDHLGQGSVI